MFDSNSFGGKLFFIAVLAPEAQAADATIDYYCDFSQSIDEFTHAFATLKIEWKWQPVTISNFKEVIDAVAETYKDKQLVVFNLCDGDGINGIPGVAVINYLEEKRLTYTGADRTFYETTTSKIIMKKAFDKAGISTAPWFAIASSNFSLNGEFHCLPKPVMIKPAISAGSMGLSVRNVVYTEAELKTVVANLYQGYHGWELSAGGFVAESFIKGREFTCFLVGSSDGVFVYPPVELRFHESLPEVEKFLSFDRLWEFYEGDGPIGDYEDLYNFFPVDEALSKEIVMLSKAAYSAVSGKGYGRIDLRRDEATGNLYVLEVNAQCGLSEDENFTSVGAILRFANEPFHQMLRLIIEDALKRKTNSGYR
ncbi:MAG: hypothetical protein M3Y85_11205 [Bacteroidota bacterium]|nr:hypothetical protein [Bacteroidota bacterium]